MAKVPSILLSKSSLCPPCPGEQESTCHDTLPINAGPPTVLGFSQKTCGVRQLPDAALVEKWLGWFPGAGTALSPRWSRSGFQLHTSYSLTEPLRNCTQSFQCGERQFQPARENGKLVARPCAHAALIKDWLACPPKAGTSLSLS